jgi:hypothetical protein
LEAGSSAGAKYNLRFHLKLPPQGDDWRKRINARLSFHYYHCHSDGRPSGARGLVRGESGWQPI